MTANSTPVGALAETAARLDALARPDKWFLSGADGVLWAPPHPVWLHRPGFWDDAHVYEHAVGPLFAIAFVSRNGASLPLVHRTWTWRPQQIDVVWDSPAGALHETRFVLPGGRFVSQWHFERATAGALEGSYVVAFTAQPGPDVLEVRHTPGTSLAWSRQVAGPRHGSLTLDCTLQVGAPGQLPGRSVTLAVRAEGRQAQPTWETTPFWDAWHGDGRPPTQPPPDGLPGLDASGYVHLCVITPLDRASAGPVRITLTLVPRTSRATRSKNTAASPSSAEPHAHWTDWFGRFPRLRCSDPFVERYYDYRIYGLGLNRLAGHAGTVRFPAIAEGIEYFHLPITYSAQCHMWETRWSSEPDVAHGSLLNFLTHQRKDGSLHGRLYTTHLRRTDFYHANWGDAVLAVQALHDDPRFARRAYDGLSRYARWMDDTRDPDRSGLYDVINHYETGQEYMSRYQLVEDEADRRGWAGAFRLQGVDVTVYSYQLKRALARLATTLDRSEEAAEWDRGAATIGDALLTHMWDDVAGLFSDVDPRTGRRTGAKAAVSFYPLLTDLLDVARVRRLLAHLEDAAEFATPFPLPSSSVDDPHFDPDARWKGKRHQCPWNGRVWPMTNSHVIEGLVRQWQGGRREVGPTAARLLDRFVKMMFHDGDLARPNCYEHYHPYTGRASVYRGIDDYQHSWVLDLLIRGVAGLEPRADGLLIDPLPLEIHEVSLEGVRARGHAVTLRRSGERMTVTMDGREHHTAPGTPLVIPW